MPLRTLPLALVLALLACTLTAEPFTLSDLHIAAPRFSPQGISIGGASDGFLLAGTASHQAVTIPLSLEGSPTSLGSNKVATGQAMRAGEPVRIGERWLVPLYTGFLGPDRFLISEMFPDGSLAGEPVAIPWPGVSGGSIAWNGRTLLLVGARKRDTSIIIDLVARTSSSDLTTVGDENLVASGIRSYRVVPASEGFVIVYRTDGGLFVARLSDDGAPIGSPAQVSAAPNAEFDAATGSGGTLVVWAEGPAPQWSLRAARVESGEVVEIFPPIPSFEGDRAHFFVRPLGDGFVVAWQGVDYVQGLTGREMFRTRIDGSGVAGAIHQVSGLAGGEVLLGAGSNGETVLLVWNRHIAGVGIPLYGATISDDTISEPKLLLLNYTTVETVDVSSPGDGTTFAAWRETSGTGTTLFAGRWNRDGERLALQSLRSVEGTLGAIALVSGGGQTLLLWRQGTSILGAWLDEDASFRGEPFFVVQRPGPFGRVPEHPAASWDGSRFIVVWVELGEVEGAFVAPSGVVSPLEVIVTPPAPGTRSSYRIVSARVASGAEGSLLALELIESFGCVGIPCPTAEHGVARLDADGKPLNESVELIAEGSSSDVASDGRDFLVTWRQPDGAHVRLVAGEDDRPPVDRQLFAHPSIVSTRVIWNGTEYVVAWGGARIYVARVDRAAASIQPLAGIDGFSGVVGQPLALGTLAGDAFVSWIDTLDDGTDARAAVADFLRDATVLPPPPSAPAGVTVRLAESGIDVSWIPVAGATGYWIETLRRDRDGIRWLTAWIIDKGETASTRIFYHDAISLRIRALGPGGSSEAVETRLVSSRRRGARR